MQAPDFDSNDDDARQADGESGPTLKEKDRRPPTPISTSRRS